MPGNPNKFNSSADLTIYIVGKRKLQNELIASCLAKETGTECILLESIHHLPSGHSDQGGSPWIIFWDCHEKDSKKLLAELSLYDKHKKTDNRIVFFNVPAYFDLNKKFVLKGVHAFFYEQDSLDIFLKGVRAVLNGKLWLSRELMTKCIFENSDNDTSSENATGALTDRQTEILAMIAVGFTNEEIADKLCISPHTVKSHIYKIFKKINVPNRVQASLWAAKNL
jgi:LuxR family transcriptional regulator, positive regulator of biofilm formation